MTKERDCANCRHSKLLEATNYGRKYSCEVWRCEFEPLLPFEEREEEQESEGEE